MKRATAIRDNDEISSMFLIIRHLANDILGKQGWITNRKSSTRSWRLDPQQLVNWRLKSLVIIVEPMLDDVASGVDAGDIRVLLDKEFEFPGGK